MTAGHPEASDTLRVLLVEDDVDANQFYRLSLQAEGLTVRSAFSGPEALEALVDDPYDVIVLDIMMTPIDGVETCRRIRQELAQKDVPICMITASMEIEYVLKAFEAGANGYIVKPFDTPELLAKINEITAI